MEKFEPTVKYKVIYAYSMPYETHKGALKVGDTTVATELPLDELVPNCRILNQAAKARIGRDLSRHSLSYKLEYTELAVRVLNGYGAPFRDYDVHNVLLNSGVHKVRPNGETGEEWFLADLATVKAAIRAFKDGESSIPSGYIV